MPRIQMTPIVRWALYCMTFYLMALLGLLVYRFLETIR